ncbi:hypothetical protein VPH35_071046 [Triticum aestivum]
MAGKIKTVVVVVQENRSFDHMLGWMKSLNPDIDGVTGAETNLVVVADHSSKAVPFRDGSQYVTRTSATPSRPSTSRSTARPSSTSKPRPSPRPASPRRP